MTLTAAIVLNSILALAIVATIVGWHLRAILASKPAATPAVTPVATEVPAARGFATPEPAIA